jgi:hypothetical protein
LHQRQFGVTLLGNILLIRRVVEGVK